MITGASLLDLRTALKQWSQRQNIPDTVLDDFINISITRAVRQLRIPPMEKSFDLAVDASGYFTIPSDYLDVKEVVSVRNNQNIILERKSIHEVDHMNNQSPGCPRYFGRYKGTFRIGPYDAATDDTVAFYYWATMAPLVADADCNWLSSNSGDLVLYGAMAELAAYTRDDEGEQRWLGKFNGELQILQSMEDRSAWNGGTIGISLGGSH